MMIWKIKFTIFIFIVFNFLAYADSVNLEKKLDNAKGDEKIQLLLELSEKHRFNDFEKSLDYANKAYSEALANNSNLEVGKALLAKASCYYFSTNLEQALENYEQALKVGEIMNSPVIIGASFNGKAIIAMKKGDLDNALQFFKKAEGFLKKSNDKEKLAGVVSNMGLIFYTKNDYINAIKFMNSAKDLYESINNLQGEGTVLISLGNVYNIIEENKGEQSFQKALDIGNKLGDYNLKTAAFVNLGSIYMKRGENEKAIEVYKKAINCTLKTNNRDYKAVALNNIGDVKVKEKKYVEALTYYKSALRIFKDLSLSARFAFCYMNIGTTYLKMNKLEKSEKNLLRGYDIAKQFKQKPYIKDSCKSLSDLYKKKGDFKKSLDYFKEYVEIKDEIISTKKINEINTLNAKTDEERKAAEIQLLKKDNEINELKMKKQQLHIYQILSFLVISLIILATLYKKYLFKVKTNYQLEKAYVKMEALAKYDALTKLHNRHSAMERVEIEMVRMGRTWRSFGLMMLDIDDFKKINDNFGHLAGDKVLQHISAILTELVRKQDVVARWGGEEFFIMLPETSIEGTAILAEKIREEIEKNPLAYNEFFLHITVTIGVSVYDRPAPFNSILSKADDALYFGKDNGKNIVVLNKGNNGDGYFFNYTKQQKSV